MDLAESIENCTDGLPIRRETYKLLTRPPEPDYTYLGMFLKVIAILCAVQALVAQIARCSVYLFYWYKSTKTDAEDASSLVYICSTGFICPFRGYAAKYPMVAPPAIFRAGSDINKVDSPTTFVGKVFPWEPELVKSVRGFNSNWPYVQMHTGVAYFVSLSFSLSLSLSLSLSVFKNAAGLFTPDWFTDAELAELDALAVPELLPGYDGKNCHLEKARDNERAFVFDPFQGSIREEFLNCPKEETLFENVLAQSGLSRGIHANTSTLKTMMTFNNKDYNERRTATITCMQEVRKLCEESGVAPNKKAPQKKFCCADLKSSTCALNTWWDVIKSRSLEVEVSKKIELCVGSLMLVKKHRCDCNEKQFRQFPILKFYQGNKIKVCKGGPRDGKVCTTGSECEPVTQDDIFKVPNSKSKVQCVEKWPKSSPIYLNEDYGCFFTAPDSMAEVSYEYYKCNFRAPGKVQTNSDQLLTNTQAEGVIDLQVSKRAALLGIFLFKELGIISAGFVLVRITLVGLLQTIWGIVYAQYVVLFVLVCNLSTSYRAFANLYQLINFTVNKSLVDMDIKINFVIDVVYTMTLLLIIDDVGNAAAPIDTTANSQSPLMVSLGLKIFQLHYNIVNERMGLHAAVVPLNDLNENRLSKFESCLLLIKLMEEFLITDVNFNFVQLFSSRQKLTPDFSSGQYNLPPVSRDDHGSIEGIFDGLFLDYVSEDRDVRKLVYMGPLDASCCGHDGQGLEFDPKYSVA